VIARAAAMPIAVLISGRGSNMRAIHEASCKPNAPFEIRAVLSDQPAAPGLEYAQRAGIATEVLAKTGFARREDYDAELQVRLAPYSAQLIVLAGFMRILSGAFAAAHLGRMLNIHPSLLPAYPGLHTHRRALNAGDKQHGATIHFVTAELDGGPRILQARVPVLENDDETSLSARVQAAELKIYPMVVRWYCEGRLSMRDNAAWLDGIQLREPVQLENAATESTHV
jgi:phosphoribosylglycinamide formyltransferase-1